MNKKLTTVLGIALGATLVTGFGIYKYFSNKSGSAKSLDEDGSYAGNGPVWDFIGNGLTKNISLYGGSHAASELVGGGLYKE